MRTKTNLRVKNAIVLVGAKLTCRPNFEFFEVPFPIFMALVSIVLSGEIPPHELYTVSCCGYLITTKWQPLSVALDPDFSLVVYFGQLHHM